MEGPRYAVVGGGIVGASVAHHLGERTSDPVVVYERGDLAAQTTFRSTAMIGVAGPDPYHRLKEYGFRLYNDFFAAPAASPPPRYRHAGRLRVATSDAGARRLAAIGGDEGDVGTSGDAGAADDADRYANSPAEYVPGGKLRDRFLLPPLDAGVVEGALYRPAYGYVLDDSRTMGARALAMEFVERARANGVRFETDTEVTDVETRDGRVTAVETDGTDRVAVDTVVCAAGPWNGELAAHAGLDLPVGHVPSPVFALTLDDPLPYSLPMIKSHESSVGIHPKGERTVLVTYTPGADETGARPRDATRSGPDPATDDAAALDAYRDRALRPARRLLPALADADLADEWLGVGTSTPDGKPIVGPTRIDGLALAVTEAGIQYAPAVGRILARQLVDGDPTEYRDAVALARFDGCDGGTGDGAGGE